MNPDIALKKCRQICSTQEKCPDDIIRLFNKWNVPDEEHQGLIAKLKSEGYINEERYARAFTRDKINFDHWGLVKIGLLLQHKGISQEIIETVFKEIDREEYMTMISAELNKKRRTIKGTPYEVWAKLARYGSSKGYTMQDMRDFLGSDAE